MQNFNAPPQGNAGVPPPAKKGLSKGCLFGIIAAVVVGLGLVVLIVAGGLGAYWLRSRALEATNARTGTTTTGGASSSSADDDGEAPQPSAAQMAAVAGGQSATWEQQEISWTVPQKWRKHSADSTTLLWRSPGTWDAASLIVSVSPMDADFPTDVSLNAFHSGAVARKASGQVDEVRWINLGGVKGVMFRETPPEDADGQQRLQWMAYRTYKGQKQLVNVMLAARGKDFARHEDALYGILYSTELSK